MKFRRNILFLFSFFLISWKPAGISEVHHVDVVFCMDMSASTNGILNEVRNRMWNIANGVLQKDELTDFRIGMVGYGRPSFGGTDGYVRIISNLTNDLDAVSYSLHQLKAVIEKGDQFVPNALLETLKGIKWSKGENSEKMVFLIGNGSAYAGSINLEDLCEEYAKNNIPVNAIYVQQEKENEINLNGYRNIAGLTHGKFYTISANPFVSINNNFGDTLVVLKMNDSLNSTFMFYTKDAADRKKFLYETDKNTFKMGNEFFYSRLYYKTSKHYFESCTNYDLTAYYIKNHSLPEKINYDFLFKQEKTFDVNAISKLVKQKAFARMRLTDEIRYMYRQIEKDTVAVNDSLLDGFVLNNYE